MSVFDDLPFEGDPNAPLPEEFKKKKRPKITYSIKGVDKGEFVLSEFDSKLIHYFAYGKPLLIDVDEEREKEKELNRVRLDVEIEASRNRALASKHEQERIDTVYHSIDLMLTNQLEKSLNRPLKYLSIGSDATIYKRIFTDLGSERLSAGQFSSLIESCDWLCSDYIRLSNTASIRRDLGASNSPEVTEYAQAINLLGIKSSLVSLPRLILENTYKKNEGIAKGLWLRFSKFYQMYAFAAFHLAKINSLNELHLYVIAAMQSMPPMVLAAMYCNQAKAARSASYDAALRQRDDFRLSVIDNYEPGPEVIFKLLHMEESMRYPVLETFNAVHIPLLETLEEGGHHKAEKTVLKQAKGFAIYRFLSAAKLLDTKEANELLKVYQMDKASLDYLQKIDFSNETIYAYLK